MADADDARRARRLPREAAEGQGSVARPRRAGEDDGERREYGPEAGCRDERQAAGDLEVLIDWAVRGQSQDAAVRGVVDALLDRRAAAGEQEILGRVRGRRVAAEQC